MEPPGKHGGPVLARHDHRHDEMFFDTDMLIALALDPSLASKGYLATIRFGYRVIGLLRVGHAELLPLQSLARPRRWVQIWPASAPAHGHPGWWRHGWTKSRSGNAPGLLCRGLDLI